jgi:Dolichyl-phosphate-mannose-protein mannosyltransferase
VKIQIDNRHQYPRSDLFLPLAIFTLTWGFIFISSGILNAGFNYFIDDHEILVSNNIHHSLQDIFLEPFTSLFSNSPKSRFRPLYDVLLRLCTQLYGLNPFTWYLSSMLVAILTTTIFYLVGRLQKFSQLEAIVFTGAILLGQQASTYTRFGTPETTATLFVALSFLFGSLNSDRGLKQNIYDFLFVIFALLAALNKEACILIIPGLAYFKIWHLARSNNISLKESFVVNISTTILLLSWFVLSLAYIKLGGVSGPGYAGIDGDTLSLLGILNSLLSNGAIFGSALIANIGYYFSRQNRNEFKFDIFYTLAALIIIPQLIIYNKTGMLWHYILPGAIGVSFLACYPMRKIAERSKKTYRIVISIILTILTLQLIFTTSYFADISKRTTPIQGMVAI